MIINYKAETRNAINHETIDGMSFFRESRIHRKKMLLNVECIIKIIPRSNMTIK